MSMMFGNNMCDSDTDIISCSCVIVSACTWINMDENLFLSVTHTHTVTHTYIKWINHQVLYLDTSDSNEKPQWLYNK